MKVRTLAGFLVMLVWLVCACGSEATAPEPETDGIADLGTGDLARGVADAASDTADGVVDVPPLLPDGSDLDGVPQAAGDALDVGGDSFEDSRADALLDVLDDAPGEVHEDVPAPDVSADCPGLTCISGTIVVSVSGIAKDISLLVDGPATYELGTEGGVVIVEDAPGGTYSVTCDKVEGYSWQVQTDDDTIDEDGELIKFTCSYTEEFQVVEGTVLVNVLGAPHEVSVTISGPASLQAVSQQGAVTLSPAPEGTYQVTCEALAGYTLEVQTDDATLDAPDEVLQFACTYTFAPRWFVVGKPGKTPQASIRYSTDGVLWSDAVGPPDAHFDDLAHGNGTFVAVGGSQNYTSTDGLLWKPSAAPGSASDYYGIHFLDGLFSLVDSSASIWSSANGVNWGDVSPPGPSTHTFSGLCSGNGRRLGVGSGFGDVGEVAWSDNGTSWTVVPVSGTSGLADCAYATGALGYFLAVGGGKVAWSYDGGLDWPWEVLSPGGAAFYAVAYGDGRFVAVGDGGRIAWAGKGGPGNWHDVGPNGGDLHAVDYGDGQFVAVGNGGRILRSTDAGETWQQVATGGADLRGVLFVSTD